MNKILNNFEAASTGNYEASKAETSDMKMILESFYDVTKEDTGDAVPQPQQLDEIASVTMSGDSADEVARLARLMNGSDQPEPTGYQGPPDMPPQEPAMITPRVMDDIETGEEETVEEETVEEESWDNEPEARYDDHHKMTKDLSGGLNRQKKSYPPTNGGDNPMALETSLAEELSAMLKQKMSEQDQDGDGDEDFADVQIARMVASGMSKEEAKKKVKDKDYNEDMDVAEDDDDPCWKNYKMVGTKKKNGKEVPNCVPKEGVEETAKKKDKEVEEEKKKGVDGKACWKGYRYAGREQKADGTYKDKCVKVNNSEYAEAAPKNNPVAKNAGKFNKAQVQTDRKKEQKKGKSVKHKGRDMSMESAPVFERYVKPFLDKSPQQMVEFYDKEAGAIIDRLSTERRSLAAHGQNTVVHEAVIGKLREGLSVLPEETLNEVRRRRGYRSGFDIGRTGYGDGKGANLGSDKAAFKRREMEVELGDEEPNNYAVYIAGKPWKVFRSERAAQKAANTIKSKYGKDTKVYQTAAPASN